MMPYFEGRDAYFAGLMSEANPYTIEWDWRCEEWDEGFFKAMREDK